MSTNTLTDAQAVRVIKQFTDEGGVFNTRLAGGRWQAQGVRGSSAETGQGDTLGEAVQNVCDKLSYSTAGAKG